MGCIEKSADVDTFASSGSVSITSVTTSDLEVGTETSETTGLATDLQVGQGSGSFKPWISLENSQ